MAGSEVVMTRSDDEGELPLVAQLFVLFCKTILFSRFLQKSFFR